MKNILFGIFTGIITGLAISFYEYRRQIYSDFYIFIKQTSDFIKTLEKMITSKKFDLCTMQAETYKDSTKSYFVLRKLRKNNKLVIDKLHLIYKGIDILYENLNKAYITYNSISLYEKQKLELYQKVLDSYSQTMSKDKRLQSFQKLNQDKSFIDKNLEIVEDILENHIEDCKNQLQSLQSLNLELYAFVNSSQHLFIL